MDPADFRFVLAAAHCNKIGLPEDETSIMVIQTAARVGASMISCIEPGSSHLDIFSPALFLVIVSMIRDSKGVRSMRSDDQYHVCKLVVDYVKRHQSRLNEQYFYALTSELYFPDSWDYAGRLAMDLLEFMNITGWLHNDSVREPCIIVLSRYLANHGQLTYNSVTEITAKIPQNAMSRSMPYLLTCSLSAMNTSSESIENLIFKMNGSEIKLSCKSNDTIDYVRYLVHRHWNTIILNPFRIKIDFNGTRLHGQQTVSSYGIVSNTTFTLDAQKSNDNITFFWS